MQTFAGRGSAGQPALAVNWIGAALPRREDARMVTGRARYLGDVVVPGVLTATFVRSPLAAASGLRVDVRAARAAPGVVAAFAADDLELRDIPGSTGRGPEAPAMTRPPLARERVRHVGEALAVVLTEGAYAGADAAELVDVDAGDAPVVADLDAALAGQALLFPAAGSNVVSSGVVPQGADPDLDRWPVRARVRVDDQRLAPVTLEPLGIVAEPDGGGGVTVWCGHQAPHRLRAQLARLLDLDPGAVRVVVPDVGGAFGMKGMLFPEYLVVVAAALRVGRPVRWLQTRSEQFTCGTHGRGMRHEVELAGEADGRIRAARVRIVADLGAYPHNGSAVPWFARFMAPGAYDIADLAVETTMVVTNRAPTGSYRGAGRPEAAFAIERAVDAFARAAALDPAQVRRRNLVPAAAMPHTTATGARYDSGDYAAALDRALALADAPAVRAEQARRRAAAAPVSVSVSVSVSEEPAGAAVPAGGVPAVAYDAAVAGDPGGFPEGRVPAAAADAAVPAGGVPAVGAGDGGRAAARGGEGGSLLGLGIGTFVERAGGDKDSGEYARVEVTAGGRVVARTGTSAAGQGHDTTWSQVVASALCVDPADVEVITGDTGAVREGTGSFASRSAQLAGSALQRTAATVRDCAREVAADLLGVAAVEVEARAGGRFGRRGAGAGAREVSLAEVARRAGALRVELAAEETFSPGAQTFPYGTCVAVVEVDVETGKVSLRDLVAVDDCGTVLNPVIVEGQVHGSLLQGVAQALHEAIVYDEAGQPLTSTLVDYAVPAAPDAPVYRSDRLVTPAPSNPLGVKGAGESGCIGAPPAVVNAVLDALAPLGVTDLQMPLTPERVWRALRDARG